MHNKLYDSITTFSKVFITLFIVLMFIITKSVYINLFATLLVIYLLLINDGNLGKYYRIFKNYFWVNILVFVLLGIVMGFSLLYTYKFIVIVLLIDILVLQLNFNKTHAFVYKLVWNEYAAYKMALSLYYINTIFMSKDEVNNRRLNLLGRFEYAKHKKNVLDSNLKTNFYVMEKEKTNFLSVVLFLSFLFLLIIVIIRK